jgi:hypothetical protein
MYSNSCMVCGHHRSIRTCAARAMQTKCVPHPLGLPPSPSPQPVTAVWQSKWRPQQRPRRNLFKASKSKPLNPIPPPHIVPLYLSIFSPFLVPLNPLSSYPPLSVVTRPAFLHTLSVLFGFAVSLFWPFSASTFKIALLYRAHSHRLLSTRYCGRMLAALRFAPARFTRCSPGVLHVAPVATRLFHTRTLSLAKGVVLALRRVCVVWSLTIGVPFVLAPAPPVQPVRPTTAAADSFTSTADDEVLIFPVFAGQTHFVLH